MNNAIEPSGEAIGFFHAARKEVSWVVVIPVMERILSELGGW